MDVLHWIVITGPPGSGKSSLRRALEPALGAESFDILDYYPRDATFTSQQAASAFSRLLAAVSARENGRPKLIEAMFYQGVRRQEIRRLAAVRQARLDFVVLDAGLECLVSRVSRRPADFTTPLTIERIARLQAGFRDCPYGRCFRTDAVSIEAIAEGIKAHVLQARSRSFLPRAMEARPLKGSQGEMHALHARR